MAKIRVRYKNGDTDEWELHDQMPQGGLFKELLGGMWRQSLMSFGVASSEGRAVTDYGMVALRMSELLMFEIDGLSDFKADAALWQELQTPEE